MKKRGMKNNLFMEAYMFSAAVLGNTDVLKDAGETLLCTTPVVGNNIVHIAVRHGRLEFINQAIALFPDLLMQKNNQGNIPLHEAAAVGNKETVQRLIYLHDLQRKTTTTTTTAAAAAADVTATARPPPPPPPPPPLRYPPRYLTEVNQEGDTPFHVALRSGNLEAAEELLEVVKHHPKILVLESSFGRETPLHLYVRYCAGGNSPRNMILDDNGDVVSKGKFIYRLTTANAWATVYFDSEGLNPLMRAAQCGRVLLVLGMLLSHPQSMEFRDRKGKVFLHHLRLRMTDINAKERESTLFNCRRILQVYGVDVLTCSRDQDGNTPVHLAILDGDYDLAQLILERYHEGLSTARKELIMTVKNSQGETISDLCTSAPAPGIPPILKKLMEQLQGSRGGLMEDNLYEAARQCNEGVFSQQSSEDDDSPQSKAIPGNNTHDGDCKFVFQDVNGKNILHIATEHRFRAFPDQIYKRTYHNFVQEAIRRFPQLMYQKDCNGDTPLHVSARFLYGSRLFEESFQYWHSKRNRNNDWLDLEVPPWKVKNARGDTPFHLAARNRCIYNLNRMSYAIKGTRSFLDDALSDVNDNGETSLHLIARYMCRPPDSRFELEHIVDFVETSKTAAYVRDIDGLTPLLRAAHFGHIWLVIVIGEKHPQSIFIIDNQGRNVLHHLLLCTSILDAVKDLESLMKSWKEASINFADPFEVILSEDDDGNTPLHLAIMNQNFEVAEYFIRRFMNLEPKQSSSYITYLVTNQCNKDGKSIRNLIAHEKGIPAKLNEMLLQQVDPVLAMEKYMYEAATNGDEGQMFYSHGPQETYPELLCQSHDGSNVIHIAIRNGRISLATEVLYHNPELIFWKDSNGDTPLHLAAGLPTNEALDFFKFCFNQLPTLPFKSYYYYQDEYPPPWKVRNSKGNTIFHEAALLCHYKLIFSKELPNEIDVKELNDNGETVLHVIARHATKEAKDFLQNMSQEMQTLVYIKDFEGFTPVLRALQSGHLGLARLLIQKCPKSISIPDNKGRTVLHHLRALVVDFVDDVNDVLPVWMDFYEKCNLHSLVIAQDKDGNTPLHSAIIDGDFNKVKFLMELCLQPKNKRGLDIVNNDGHTVFDLVASPALIRDTPALKELQPLVNRSYVKERELLDEMMDEDLYKAAITGNVQIFEPAANEVATNDEENKPPPRTEASFCKQTPGGSTIVHIALRHGKKNVEEFLKAALGEYPILSMRPDSNGDTPLHLAAKWKSGVSLVNLLIDTSKRVLERPDNSNTSFQIAPWAMKNYKGSFPIHEALQTSNLEAAYALLRCDKDAASRVNDLGDTPLHSFAKNGFSISGDEADKFVKKLFDKDNQAAYKRDDEGLTPLLSAARSGRLQVAQAILKYCPQSAYLGDPCGRTFLHLLRFTGEDVDESLAESFENTGKELFKIPEVDAQRLVQDYEGNTPLHQAIKTHNSVAAIVLTRRCLDHEEQRELGLVNKEGHTIPDLLAFNDVPTEIIDLIRKKVPKAVNLARSSYGIRKTEMKESANALSVVAALLATITFAAAFQIPGGFGDDGFPILSAKVAFAIFSVANTIAMCSSMLCLFLLLWVMGIGKIHGSLKVLDISIGLLRVSFYLTLVTFTSGVFVSTVEKSLWMGIFVCVFGILTILLAFKTSIKTIAKFGERIKKKMKSKPPPKTEVPTEMSEVTVNQTAEINDQMT